jgi:CheY-like chemotaxis protein
VLADFPSLPANVTTLVDAIRAYAPSARLVGCAAAPQQEETEEARRCGVVAFLPKPLRDSELLGACQAALRKRPQTGLQLAQTNGKASRTAVVLLVEDNVINQRVAEQILKRRGHEVRIAHNGHQAVDVLEKWTPDLVFMDVQMPEMNGIDATKAIRAREQARGGHVPIIALTAHAMAADRELCLRAGMDDYLTKPVSPVALTQTVERIVEQRSTNPQSSDVASPAGSDPILDPNVALERVDGDRELLGEIIALFQQDIDALVQELERAVQAKDPEGIMRTAHRLKGSVATFAAKPATDAALRLETMGRNGDIGDAAAAFRVLQTELARLQPALESLKVEAQG